MSKQKIFQKKIESCSQCGNFSQSISKKISCCNPLRKSLVKECNQIHDPTTIPEWCPLDDWEEKR